MMKTDQLPNSAPISWRFDWGDIRGEVAALGGMLGPVWFKFPDGEEVQPFAVAPWAKDPPEKLALLPPILRHLRGEWPCVPFGIPETRSDLPPHWMQGISAEKPASDTFIHGFSSNHLWHLVEQAENHIIIAIDYPSDHPVKRLTRRISRGQGLVIDISLTIEMRRDAELPIGIHPVFALPLAVGAAKMEIPSLRSVRSFPVAVEPGTSVLLPDQISRALQEMQTYGGETLDCSKLPLGIDTEELLLVELESGEVKLANAVENYEVHLTWDVDIFQRCLLWISNSGRSAYPWNARFRAIGIEPVTAAFDLGEVHSANASSPLAHAAKKTNIPLKAGKDFVTQYHIAIQQMTAPA